jgi:3-dehydroquinate synthase
MKYVLSSLKIKKRFIEIDEFDRGVRNIFNYGHSFGHALEAATNYGIPHGIAVSMGMQIANSIAADRGLLPRVQMIRMYPVLHKNYDAFKSVAISPEIFFGALSKDKKNTSSKLALILPVGDTAQVQRVEILLDNEFRAQCIRSLEKIQK